jgi:hypothetical protein
MAAWCLENGRDDVELLGHRCIRTVKFVCMSQDTLPLSRPRPPRYVAQTPQGHIRPTLTQKYQPLT